MDNEALVAAMAQQIRYLYFTCYRNEKLRREGVASTWGDKPVPRYDGGDTETSTHQPVWPQIARLCLKHQFEPAAFIRAQFASQSSHLPLPTVLLGDGAVNRYQDDAARSELEIRKALRVQMQNFGDEVRWRVVDSEGKLDADAACKLVLRDRSFSLSGLFRYCAAVSGNAMEIAAIFFEDALLQYSYQRGVYDKIWGSLIPQPLRASVVSLLKGGSNG